jgi:hypothetical protein
VVGVEAGMEEAKQGPILALVGPHLLCSTPPPSCVGTRDLLLRQLVKMMLYNASSRVCRISENGTRVSTEEATHGPSASEHEGKLQNFRYTDGTYRRVVRALNYALLETV